MDGESGPTFSNTGYHSWSLWERWVELSEYVSFLIELYEVVALGMAGVIQHN